MTETSAPVVIPEGAVAVVTGASRGLGAGLAQCFASAGLRLGLCARQRPELAGEDVFSGAVDVTQADHVVAFADHVIERFGRIDLWVNNAGVLGPIGPLADADPADLHQHVETNVYGLLVGSQAFIRHVRRRPGHGVLINIASGAATHPYAGWAVYCASKAAVVMATEVISLEESKHGLRAYALSPGVVDTDMQVAIRSTSAEHFPAVDRFLQIHHNDAFTSPRWIADYLLQLTFGSLRPDSVAVRIPDQPTSLR